MEWIAGGHRLSQLSSAAGAALLVPSVMEYYGPRIGWSILFGIGLEPLDNAHTDRAEGGSAVHVPTVWLVVWKLDVAWLEYIQ